MKVFYGGRGTGKTRELIEEAAKHENSVIACENVERMKEKLMGYGHPTIEVVDYGAFLARLAMFNDLAMPYDKVVFVDEGEKFLRNYLYVGGITICEEKE